MVSTASDVDRYIGTMINNFVNKQHKIEVEEFIHVRGTKERNGRTNKPLSRYTIRNDTQALLSLDHFLKNKPFKDATQENLEEYERFLKNEYSSPGGKKKTKGLTDATVEQYMIHVKRFYKYLYNKEKYQKNWKIRKTLPYPECVEWIQSSGNTKEIFKEDLPTEQDILKILEVCENPRDQAMICSGLADGGFRVGELITLNCNSVIIDNYGVKFKLPDIAEYESGGQKTGRGIVRLFIIPSSTNYIKDFINHHPFYKYKDKFNVPLFYTMDSRTYQPVLRKANDGTVTQSDFESLRLSRPGIEGILKKYCNLAGVKTYRPHDLRHWSATRSWELGFNEPELRVRFRWSTKSKMPSRYIHPTDKAIEKKIKIITGKEEEIIEPSKLAPVECWNCQDENTPTAKFCQRCGSNLKPTKDEMKIDATSLGVAVQKGMNSEEVEKITKQVLVNLLEEFDLKKKEKKKD